MPKYRAKNHQDIGEDGKKSYSIVPKISVGTATMDDGEEVQICTTWGQSPVIVFADGSEVVWSWDDLINEAIELKGSVDK